MHGKKYNIKFKNIELSVSSLSNWKGTYFSGRNQFLGFGYFLCFCAGLIFRSLSPFTSV